MNQGTKVVFPIGDGYLMRMDKNNQPEVKTLTARTPEELAQLQKLGWKVQE